jgi:hypothetical protein
MSEVKPALTSAEWEDEGYHLVEDAGARITSGFLYVQGWDDAFCLHERRHALAALALYNQPFGFTREDVKLLREKVGPFNADRAIYAYEVAEIRSIEAVIASLADRIEALLPPENISDFIRKHENSLPPEKA